LSAYARARLAATDGHVGAAAAGYAEALAARPEDELIAIRAYREALAAGDIPLALSAAAVLDRSQVAPADAAVLAFADALATGNRVRAAEAAAQLDGSPLEFMTPVLLAWLTFDSDPAAALAMLETGSDNALTRRYASESRALMQIGSGDVAGGVAALRVLLAGDQSSLDLRLNAAMLLAGQRQGNLGRALLVGDDPVLSRAAQALRGVRADSRFGASRLFVRLGSDLTSDGTQALAIALARSALRLDPTDDRARLILVDGLAREGAEAGALATIAEIGPKSLFAHPARVAEIFVLQRAGRGAESLALAQRLATAPDASANDARTYADLLFDAERFAEAADAYALVMTRGGAGPAWVTQLQRGGALERAGRWAEALPFLKKAVELAPNEATALNYLGYAQAERGENLTEALALLERASALQPNDAAITDSLGWAYFQNGFATRALPLIERAARGEPADPTIQEHLGDAYWRVGRRYEARYAWRAAALYATGEHADRIAMKLASGPKIAAR
jgi:tetratricopeptide (TPR) repeat protein